MMAQHHQSFQGCCAFPRLTGSLVVVVVQVVLAFLIRPPPDSHMRKYWNIGHYWWGRLILVVSLGNFFFGIWMLHSTPILYIVPAAILLFWCFVGLVKVGTNFLALSL